MKHAAFVVVAFATSAASTALAQDAEPFAPAPRPQASSQASSQASTPSAPVLPAKTPAGVAVLSVDDAADVAWPLAQAVYGDSGLRPAGLDDATARALAGEKPAPDAAVKVRELSEVRAAVHGDDVASRRLLASLARELNVSAIALVFRGTPKPTCRLFLASSGQMDVVSLGPDQTDGPITWRGAVDAMRPRVGNRDPSHPEGPRADAAPAKNASEKEDPKASSGSFLSSKFFWGAVVVAALAGAIVLATSKSSSATDTSSVALHGHVQ